MPLNEWRKWAPISHATQWLLSELRYGASTEQIWKPYHQFGSSTCPTAFLVIGGLSANGVIANRQLSRTLHRTWQAAHTWSRNLSGHTGRHFDFSGSRFWHWITDGATTLRKLTYRHHKQDIVLVGHSTGGLVVLALAILFQLFPRKFTPGDQSIQLRGVLIFPPFRLKRRHDTILLSMVALLYYIVCPAAFLLLALSGPWMWPLSVLAFLLHILFVPQISVPSGEERARQEADGQRWIDMPEGVLLSLACIYFVISPPLIALGAGVFPGRWSSGAFALFIATLLAPLFLMPREVAPVSAKRAARQIGYQWLPIITVANLVILQWILRPLLRLVRCPILILEGELDKVVTVDPTWTRALGSSNVETALMHGYQHSGFSRGQQVELANLIIDWCRRGNTSSCTAAATATTI